MENLILTDRPGCLVAKVTGEVTVDITTALKSRLEEQLTGGEYEALVMDLSKVTFMDSSGIGALVAMNTRTQNLQKKFYIFMPSENVIKTLELVHLLNFFEVIESEDDLEIILPE